MKKMRKTSDFLKIINFIQFFIDFRRFYTNSSNPDPIESGSEGTVTYVDDAGNIHIVWDNHRTLALIHGVDKYQII